MHAFQDFKRSANKLLDRKTLILYISSKVALKPCYLQHNSNKLAANRDLLNSFGKWIREKFLFFFFFCVDLEMPLIFFIKI